MHAEPAQNSSRKPWYRPRNILLAIALVLVLLVISLLVWAYTVEPVASTDYAQAMIALSEEAQPPGENAWPYVEQACAILTHVQDQYDPRMNASVTTTLYALAPISPESSPEEVELAYAYLEALERTEVYDLLDRAMRCPRMIRPVDTGETDALIGILLPYVTTTRGLAKANTVRMVHGIEQGDIDTAVEAFEQNLALTRHLCHQTTLIEHLVGYAIVSMTLDRLTAALDDRTKYANTLVRFAAAMDRQGPVPSVELALRGEQLSMLDMVQRTFSDDGNGSGWFLLAFVESDPLGLGTGNGMGPIGPGTPAGPRILNIGGLAFASRADHVREINFMVDESVRLLHLPAADRANDPFNVGTHVQQLGWRYRLLNVLIPTVTQILPTCDTIKLKWDGLRLRLAIECHRAKYGSFPASLDELVPEWIDDLPVDPYNGGPLVYQVLTSARGEEDYRLVSYGIDGKDDTLVTGEEDPEAFIDDEAAGDFVIHAPTPPRYSPENQSQPLE
jgi:hypothetical protein